MNILDTIITEDVKQDAKRLGLEYLGFGKFGKNRKVTHISVNNKLIPVKNKVAKHLSKKVGKKLENTHPSDMKYTDFFDEIVLEAKFNALVEKNEPTSPDKWAKAKAAARAKFDVYPSAYANLWASKKYKSMGGGWKRKKKGD